MVTLLQTFPKKVFNKFFTNQCTPLNNINKKLCNQSINDSDISTIISNLDPNKSHGWDHLSVRMIKLGANSLIYPLKRISGGAFQKGKYPDCWKKANVVPVHKKEKSGKKL